MPPRTDPEPIAQNLWVCTDIIPDEANAVLYCEQDQDFWVQELRDLLLDGKRVAVKGRLARRVVDQAVR